MTDPTDTVCAGNSSVLEDCTDRKHSVQYFYYGSLNEKRGDKSQSPELLQAWRAGPLLALRRGRSSREGVVIWLTDPELKAPNAIKDDLDEIFGDMPLSDDEQALGELREWLSIHSKPEETEIPWRILSRMKLDPKGWLRVPVLYYCDWDDLTPDAAVFAPPPAEGSLERLVAEWDD